MVDPTGAPSAAIAVAGQTFTGTAFGDKLTGGAGDDIFKGLGGADTLDGGAVNDRFFWTAGDGGDIVEGGAGADTQFLIGSQFDLFASGANAIAGVGEESLTLHGVEAIQLQAKAGTTVGVFDLSTTDVRQVVVQLDGLDAVADTVQVIGALSGPSAADVMTAQVLSASSLRVFDSVNGVIQTTVVTGVDGKDTLLLLGGPGDDNFAVTTPKGVALSGTVVVNGGDGADTVAGSMGVERLSGATGNDSLNGGAGNDTLDGGTGSDTLDGGAGLDTQIIDSSGGANVLLFRSLTGGHLEERVNGAVSDAVNVESIQFTGTDGQRDFFFASGFENTSVRFVDVDFGAGGTLDTFGLDLTSTHISISQLNGSTDVGIIESLASGDLIARVHHIDSSDFIEIDTSFTNDVIDLRNLNPGSGDVRVDGGSGSDTMIAGFGTIEFVFNVGLHGGQHDVIEGFKPNAFLHHTILLRNSFDRSLTDMLNNHHIFQSGADVVLTGVDGATLTLTNTSLGSLSSGDFLFN